jgi:hypothetical protein
MVLTAVIYYAYCAEKRRDPHEDRDLGAGGCHLFYG